MRINVPYVSLVVSIIVVWRASVVPHSQCTDKNWFGLTRHYQRLRSVKRVALKFGSARSVITAEKIRSVIIASIYFRVEIGSA